MAKRKEKVIIFEGEDKFVKPRNHSYDIGTGKSEFVGSDGEGKDVRTNIPPLNAETKDAIQGGSGMPLPQLSSPTFCADLATYISTNGGGAATPNETMAAYDMFQRYCNKPEDSTTSTTTSTTTEAPKPSTNVVVPAVPVVPVMPILPSTNLGVRPVGGGGGGGSEDAAPEKKKKSYWWLLLVALGIYLVAKKKKD
jgi:hypothetical protein